MGAVSPTPPQKEDRRRRLLLDGVLVNLREYEGGALSVVPEGGVVVEREEVNGDL